MSTFNLGLPTDIPWERICFTDDMVHAPICGSEPPEAWQPSIAVFRYEPDAEYQTLQLDGGGGSTIAYLKVTVSLTPDVTPPIAGVNQVSKVPSINNMGKWARKVSPCYGALMHVSVGPKGGGSAKDIYFADVEPKKREVYEAVTDTGEVASGSGTRLSVGKSAMISDSTESFSGGSAGVSLNIPAVGSIELSGQKSSTNTSVAQRSDVTSTDRSTERRELHSHTTQLAQLYNLLQAFHVGTNRAVFFMEPRPHILQNEATFINGPRALEGIQEVFLVVVRPRGTDFCVNVQLETAHLNTTTMAVDANGEHVIEIDHTAKIPSAHNRFDSGDDTFETIYAAPAGWVIDVEKTRDEKFEIIEDINPTLLGTNTVKITSISQAQVKVTGKVGWSATAGTESAGTLKANLLVHLKPAASVIRDQIDQMYLRVRKLCCCADSAIGPVIDGDGGGGGTIPGTTPPGCPPSWLDEFVIGNDPRFKWTTEEVQKFIQRHLTGGPPVPTTLQESAQLANIMRSEMLKSVGQADGDNPCMVPFQLSDMFFKRVVDGLQSDEQHAGLDTAVSTSPILPSSVRDAILGGAGDMSVGALLTSNTWTLSEQIGKTFQETVHIKDQILKAVVTSVPPVSSTPLRTVTGVRVGTTYPDAANPRFLAEMEDPHKVLVVDPIEQPNFIDITFSGKPDEGTITSSSIIVKNNATTISTQIQTLTANTIRVYLLSAIAPGQYYKVTVLGSGASAVTFDGVMLDGDPKSLPSGDGIEGGDFTFAIRGRAIPTAGVPSTDTLLKVVGVRLASTLPSSSMPKVLSSIGHPAEILEASYSDQPDVIIVEFNEQPDMGTVTTSSFTITKDGSAVSTSVTLGSDKTAKLVISDPLVANALYRINMNSAVITYMGRSLDGEPYRFPTGDGFGGGNFSFLMRPVAPVSPPGPAIPDARLRVLGARLMSSQPNPSAPRLLTEMIHPATVQIVNAADVPDIIEIDFSEEPDTGTVDADSFTIGQGSAALDGTVTMPSARTARLTLHDPLEGGAAYTVTLLGSGADAITWGSEPLDGDPITLPSGDGTAGGDFTFRVGVMPAAPELSTLPLIRVKSLRVWSDYPDPDNLRLLTSSFHPSETMLASLAAQPNIIDVEFTAAPDGGTVTATSFTIASASGTVAHTVAMLNATTARMTITGTLTAGTTYTITVKGDGGSAVTYQTRNLDGEATGYPSGDGVEGGDFVVKMKVLA